MLRQLWIPTSTTKLLQSQERLLAHHRLTPLFKRNRVSLPSTRSTSLCGTDETLTLNSVEYQKDPHNTTPATTCLLAHGLGSGLALFHSNLHFLSQRFDRVVAVDWLGFGGSSRPSFGASPDTPDTTESADFFLSSLKEFVTQTRLSASPFTFIGHSLGGLLAAEYTMRYPADVKQLYLISPAGLPAPPPDATFVSHQKDASTALKLLDTAWQSNVTPGAIVRALGPQGPARVKEVLIRRFRNRWNEHETELLADYLYHITAAVASGEYAMNGLLTPMLTASGNIGLFARRPLVHRMQELTLPVHVAYGDNDWLHASPGCEEAVDVLHRSGVDITLEIINNAGHHVYMDNPAALHASIEKFCDGGSG